MGSAAAGDQEGWGWDHRLMHLLHLSVEMLIPHRYYCCRKTLCNLKGTESLDGI